MAVAQVGELPGGQELKGLFSDPWSSALEQVAELQIICGICSVLTDV